MGSGGYVAAHGVVAEVDVGGVGMMNLCGFKLGFVILLDCLEALGNRQISSKQY